MYKTVSWWCCEFVGQYLMIFAKENKITTEQVWKHFLRFQVCLRLGLALISFFLTFSQNSTAKIAFALFHISYEVFFMSRSHSLCNSKDCLLCIVENIFSQDFLRGFLFINLFIYLFSSFAFRAVGFLICD